MKPLYGIVNKCAWYSIYDFVLSQFKSVELQNISLKGKYLGRISGCFFLVFDKKKIYISRFFVTWEFERVKTIIIFEKKVYSKQE